MRPPSYRVTKGTFFRPFHHTITADTVSGACQPPDTMAQSPYMLRHGSNDLGRRGPVPNSAQGGNYIMFKSFALKVSVLAAAGVAAFCFGPMAAQAVTVTHTVGDPVSNVFEGLTYPDTSAGLAACDTEGRDLVAASNGDDINFTCPLGDPDPGVYNLWIEFFKPGVCRTC